MGRRIFTGLIFSDDHPRKFIISGISSVADLLNIFRDSVRISIMNAMKPGEAMIAYTNPKTREYEFNLPQGDYQLNYEGYGGEKVTRKLNLPFSYPSDSYIVPETVLPGPIIRQICMLKPAEISWSEMVIHYFFLCKLNLNRYSQLKTGQETQWFLPKNTRSNLVLLITGSHPGREITGWSLS